MKTRDFASYVSGFISNYIPNERGYRHNTLLAYRDALVLLIRFLVKEKGIRLEKISLSKITRGVVLDFLDWLENQRKCSVSTRNARLSAIHAFYKYVRYESVENLDICQEILAIEYKRTPQPIIKYMSIEGVKLILKQPNSSSRKGLRDLALLSLLYDSAARVQELIDIVPSDLNLNRNPTLKLTGKGNKTRLIPLVDAQTDILKKYISSYGLDSPRNSDGPLFFNSRKEKLTRGGIRYIVQKYFEMAKKENEHLLPSKISSHSFRHSKATHLLEAKVNLVYIRDFLGHVSIQTTEIYARVNSQQKREALEEAHIDVVSKEKPMWEGNDSLLTWLNKF